MNIISLCMIVKNEEKVLGRCLDSVQGFIDEIILVDTGSTDRTKEIANQYNCKVIDFPWVQDFAAARNESLKHATGRWILVLDADEYLDAEIETKTKLRETLFSIAQNKPLGFVIPIINIMGDSNNNQLLRSSATRLFPNLPDIRYERPIHEQLRYKGGYLQNTQLNMDFAIFHTGYKQETVEEKNKSKRNLEIFQSIMDKGQTLDPYFCFTLANEHRSIKEHKKAEYYYKKALSKASPSDPWYPHCVDGLLHSLFALDKVKEVWDLIQSSIKLIGPYSDYHYFMGVVYKHFGFFNEAIQQYEAAVALAEKRTSSNSPYFLISPEYGNIMPYEELATIYHLKIKNHDTVKAYSKILNVNPKRTNIFLRLAALLVRHEDAASIIPFVEKIYPLQQINNLIILFHIFLRLNHTKLAHHYFLQCQNRNMTLPVKSMLHYALLIMDKGMFDKHLAQIDKDAASMDELIFIVTASCLWNDDNYLQVIKEMTQIAGLNSYEHLCLSIIHHDHLFEYWPSTHEFIFTLAVFWLDLQVYELFDQLVENTAHPEFINRLADHFYDNQQYDFAIQFYRLLMEENNLQPTGYENLAHYYLNQGSTEDALACLEAAVERNIAKPSLIPMYCIHSNDPVKKEYMLRKFEDTFPHHKSLPFIKNLYIR